MGSRAVYFETKAALVAALKDGKVRRADVQHAAANILKTYVRISLARKR